MKSKWVWTPSLLENKARTVVGEGLWHLEPVNSLHASNPKVFCVNKFHLGFSVLKQKAYTLLSFCWGLGIHSEQPAPYIEALPSPLITFGGTPRVIWYSQGSSYWHPRQALHICNSTSPCTAPPVLSLLASSLSLLTRLPVWVCCQQCDAISQILHTVGNFYKHSGTYLSGTGQVQFLAPCQAGRTGQLTLGAIGNSWRDFPIWPSLTPEESSSELFLLDSCSWLS